MPKDRQIQVLGSGDDCPELPITERGGEARAVIWPGMGAKMRSMHRVRLPAGVKTVEFSHPMEAVYYVIGGTGRVLDLATRSDHDLVEGSMVHVEPETRYQFEAGDDGVEFLGGPCPADPALYENMAD